MPLLKRILSRSQLLRPVNELRKNNDDLSYSSTRTVDRDTSNKESPSSNSKKSTKSVSFNLETTVIGHSVCGHENSLILWYDYDETSCFKEETKIFGRKVAKEESRSPKKSYTSALVRTYKACCQVKQQQDSEETFSLSNMNSKKLSTWLNTLDDRIGAEYNCIKFLRHQKRQVRKEIVALVMELQQNSFSMCEDDSVYDKSEQIRKSCERVSLPSRLFARIVAEAYDQSGSLV